MIRITPILAATLLLSSLPAAAADCTRTSTGNAPLTTLGTDTYQGAQGGLYPGGANERPAAHEAMGTALARLAVPRNAAGLPDAAYGRSVLLTIGMSNTRSESQQLVAMSQTDPLRHPRVKIVNGAQGGQDAVDIADPAAPYWTYVDQQVAAAGATAAQVQAVWLKQAIAGANEPFPNDAKRLQNELREIVLILKARFPNLFLVYLSSRIYAGYATTALNPEPYAYQGGFAVKWLVEEQIASGVPAPWLSWGPYLWADGTTTREDGLVWLCSDFAADGTHPNATGAAKVASMILDFLHTDSTAKIFYTGN